MEVSDLRWYFCLLDCDMCRSDKVVRHNSDNFSKQRRLKPRNFNCLFVTFVYFGSGSLVTITRGLLSRCFLLNIHACYYWRTRCVRCQRHHACYSAENKKSWKDNLIFFKKKFFKKKKVSRTFWALFSSQWTGEWFRHTVYKTCLFTFSFVSTCYFFFRRVNLQFVYL